MAWKMLPLAATLGLLSGIAASASAPEPDAPAEEENPPPAAETPAGAGGEVDPPRDETAEGTEPIEIVITAPKAEPTPGAPLVIRTEDVPHIRLSTTADGLLENTAGVDLSRRRFAGNENSRLTLRGFDESRSRILLNGRNLHGAGVFGGYYVDWDSLSVTDIESLTLIRGAAPAKYGNTLGGVVDLETRQGSEEPETQVSLEGGLIDEDAREETWNGRMSHSGSSGPLRYTFSAGHDDTDGYLRNAFSERDTFSAGLTWQITEDLDLTLSGRYTRNESGMIVYNRPDSPYYDPDEPDSLSGDLGGPGLPFKNGPGAWGPFYPGDDSRWKDRRLNLDLALSYETDDFGATVRAYFMDQDRKDRFYSISRPGHLVFLRESEPEKNNWGWSTDLEHGLDALGHHTIEYGASGTYLGYGDIDVEYFDPQYFVFPGGNLHPNLQDTQGKATITQWHGAYLQDTWAVTETLTLEPGIRFDSFTADGAQPGHIGMDEDRWSPRFAVTVYPWEEAHLTGRYGRAYRFPTIPEYYWWNAGFQPPARPDLTSEKAHQWELEWGQAFPSETTVTVRGYYYNVRDYIRTVFGYRPSRVVYNVDQVRLGGVEVEVSQELPHDFRVWANYTFQRSRKEGDTLDSSADLSDELVELPHHKANLGIGYRKKDGLEADLTMRYVSARRAVRGDLTQPGGSYLRGMDPFIDLDFTASLPLWKGKEKGEARWILTLDNLLDRHYEEEYGFPLPGLTVMTGLKATF